MSLDACRIRNPCVWIWLPVFDQRWWYADYSDCITSAGSACQSLTRSLRANKGNKGINDQALTPAAAGEGVFGTLFFVLCSGGSRFLVLTPPAPPW